MNRPVVLHPHRGSKALLALKFAALAAAAWGVAYPVLLWGFGRVLN